MKILWRMVLKIEVLQGFPRTDIDIPTVRADRHRLAGNGNLSVLD